jgi:hypothetical protein
MNQEDLIFKTILSCVPLRQLGENGRPVNHASGVIINYCGKKVILSVFHATRDFSNWAVEIKSDFATGTLLKGLGLMGSACEANIISYDIKRIDFSYATLPDNIQTFHQVIDTETYQIYEHERMILDINFEIIPTSDKKYSFFGQTEFKNNGMVIIPVSKLIMNMDFVGESEGFYIFKLPFTHPGHKYFRGTSGAPILDDDGNIASLVCGGKVENDLIYGLKLSKYKSLIDIQVDNINK